MRIQPNYTKKLTFSKIDSLESNKTLINLQSTKDMLNPVDQLANNTHTIPRNTMTRITQVTGKSTTMIGMDLN